MNTSDEMLHQHFAYEVLRIMRDVEKYPEWEKTYEARKEIVDSIAQVELDWNTYLTDGRQVIGLNKEFLDSVVKFFATMVYHKLDMEAPFERVYESPINHLNYYFDTSLIQTANQELQQTGYKVGALVEDDMENIEWVVFKA